jgi:hypothetical protein
MSVEAHDFDPETTRQLFSLAVSSPELVPAVLNLPSPNFVCLLAWDARGASVDAVSALAARLLRAGASYFVCWGPDCERVHDLIDEMASEPTFGVPNDSCIMTTWHATETLEDAIEFFLVSSSPDDAYYDSTGASLAISIGSNEWAAAISSALEDVPGFVRRASPSDVA